MPSEALLSTSEAADLLGVSRETIRRWALARKVTHIRLPSGQLRFRLEDIQDALEPIPPAA
jgi:excisionase family DNA binding protein